MASINTRLNIEKLNENTVQKHGGTSKKLDGNIVQKHGGSKQVGFKQLGPGVETGVHGVHDEKRVWFEVEYRELKGGAVSGFSEVTTKCMKSGVAKHLGVAGLQQQNGLVNETNMTLFAKDMLGFFGWLASIKQGMLEPVKVKCIFLGYRKGMVDNKLWRFDDVTSNVVLYRNMSFNESGEYKKTFIGSGVGTSSMRSMQVLHGFEFKEVQTQDLIYYHPARDREQHSWKAGLKDDMDARSDVYVLSNGCKKCSDDSDGYYWESTPGIRVVISKGVTVRIHNEKLVQTLLKGHSILSLEGSLSGDCDVEKNGKWSCIYAVGSQEYQMVCTRLDIASADVAAYMTLTGAWKKEIWLKGLLAESGYELSLVAGIATGALVKGGSRSEVPAQVEGAAYRY
ncbi:hypothetical protein Tco_0058769 [Tanacetum coccineum]